MFAKCFLQLMCINFLFSPTIKGSPVGYIAINDHDTILNYLSSTMKMEKFGDSLYYFGVIFKGNFYQAMQFCKFHGMELISIESKEENYFIFDYLQTFLTPADYLFWSSGLKPEPDNRWVWMSTGKPMVYTNWSPGQPSNVATKRYLEIKYSAGNRALMFNDQVPMQCNHVICEVSVSKSFSNCNKD